ncbi:MAG: GNAT family N-acetyltransferase [Planctomycetaceae bacterium]|nr:GNAT family N-acetyltransferase [Planctomycetaceae bacterium]
MKKNFVSKIIHKIFACLSLLRRGRFFVLAQVFSEAFIPKRFFGLNKHIFYSLAKDKQLLVSTSDIVDKIEIVLGTKESVAEIVRDLYSDDSAALEFYENFYHEGIEPWIARYNDKAVGVVWLYTGYYLANWEGYAAWLLQIQIEPTAKFVANVFVEPSRRGQKIFPLIMTHCTSIYCNNKFYSCVDESNVTSIKAHERIGFRWCAAAYYIRFFQRTYCIFLTKKDKNSWKRRCFMLPRGKAVPVSIFVSDADSADSDLNSADLISDFNSNSNSNLKIE